jgi:hypothetical protein
MVDRINQVGVEDYADRQHDASAGHPRVIAAAAHFALTARSP